MSENNIETVEKFFEKLKSDEVLRKKLDDAVAAYPGSLEIRESLCEETLIPVAKEAGFDFTLSDLRKYETRLKMRHGMDVEIDPNEPDDDTEYWLVDRGWSNDESIFREAAEKAGQ